jgi:Flp pilus assembly protein TadG
VSRLRRIAARRDRGSISILFISGLIAIVMIIGFSVDGSGQIRAAQRATDIAAEAARTGAQMINLPQAINGGPKVIDWVPNGPSPAATAVQSYLAAAGATGTIEVSPDHTQITVHVTLVYRTEVIDLFGIDTLTVHGSATATVVPTNT